MSGSWRNQGCIICLQFIIGYNCGGWHRGAVDGGVEGVVEGVYERVGEDEEERPLRAGRSACGDAFYLLYTMFHSLLLCVVNKCMNEKMSCIRGCVSLLAGTEQERPPRPRRSGSGDVCTK